MALSIRPCFPALFLTGVLAAGLGGCTNNGWFPEGRYVSDDKFRYDSTALQPTTIVLIDTRTNETIRTWEIPVDKELVIQFIPGKGGSGRVAPDRCEFDIWPIGTSSGTPSQSMNCPPADSRRVDVIIRPAELPADMKPAEATSAEAK